MWISADVLEIETQNNVLRLVLSIQVGLMQIEIHTEFIFRFSIRHVESFVHFVKNHLEYQVLSR